VATPALVPKGCQQWICDAVVTPVKARERDIHGERIEKGVKAGDRESRRGPSKVMIPAYAEPVNASESMGANNQPH
jgi:hypothetical protein